MLQLRRARPLCPLLLLVVALGSSAPVASGRDDQLEFLGQLKKQGLGEAAVDFLELLRESGQMSPGLAETVDLELSEALLLSAKSAISARARDELLSRAENARQKFVDAHPQHARAVDALSKKGDLSFEMGLRKLFEAKQAKDPAAKTTAFGQARTAFEEAREPFELAVTAAKTKLAEKQAAYDEKYQKKTNRNKRQTKAPPRGREQVRAEEAIGDALFDWLDARFKVIQIDYYTAQTLLADSEKNDRMVALQRAAKAFNQIYQEYRYADDNRVSLMAHAWEGRCHDELGDLRTAQDIYDEVLSIMPEGDRDKAIRQMGGFEPLFAQVSYFNFLVLERVAGPEKFVAEASQWLKDFKSWNRQPGYQGIVLEVTKAQFALADGADEQRKKQMQAEAVRRLQENSKIPSEHNGEINLLWRQYRKATPSTADGDPTTLEEAVALAEEAVAAADWAVAADYWQRAAVLAEKRTAKKDAKLVDKVKDGLPYAQFRQLLARSAEAMESSDGAADALLAAFHDFDKLATDHAERPIGPVAAAQAVKVALTLYAHAKGQPNQAAGAAALARLTSACDRLVDKWPDRAEADDARIALGQAALVRGELGEALQVFDRVNPQSDRYPTALFLAGQTHWQLYQLERKKPTGPDPQVETAQLKLAAERLRECRAAHERLREAALQKNPEAASDPSMELQQREAQVRLAEVLIELHDGPSAAELVRPLVEAIRAAEPAEKWKSIDNLTMRIFLAAVKAHILSGELAQADQASRLLTDRADDTTDVNKLLNSFVKMLFDTVKRAQEDIATAQEHADAAAEAAARQRLERNQQVLGQMLDRLAQRQQNPLESRIYVAMVAGQIGRDQVARELYQQVLKQAEADPEFLKKFDLQVTRIRADLVGLQRKEGNYAQAIEAIDGLLAARPGVLPLLMERGRILEAWSEKEPRRLADAIAHWTEVRGKLGTLAKRPPEYFEANYSAAVCLYRQSQLSGDDDKRTTALKLLNGLILTNPTLNGQLEMAAKYRALISKIQGGKKAVKNSTASR